MDVIKTFNRLEVRGTEKARKARKKLREKIPVLILTPTVFGDKDSVGDFFAFEAHTYLPNALILLDEKRRGRYQKPKVGRADVPTT